MVRESHQFDIAVAVALPEERRHMGVSDLPSRRVVGHGESDHLDIPVEEDKPALRRRFRFREITCPDGIFRQHRHVSADPPKLRDGEIISEIPSRFHAPLVLRVRSHLLL